MSFFFSRFSYGWPANEELKSNRAKAATASGSKAAAASGSKADAASGGKAAEASGNKRKSGKQPAAPKKPKQTDAQLQAAHGGGIAAMWGKAP